MSGKENMKKEYIEKIPAQEIKHNIIVCDNPDCEKVIKDNDEELENHFQKGDCNGNLLDFCSEKCMKQCG